MARLQGGASASRQLPYRWAAAAHSAEHSPGLAGGAGDGQQGAAPAPPFVGRSTAGASSPTLPPAAAGAKAPFNTSESAAAAVAAAVAGPSTSGGGKGTTTANATASATAVSPDHAPDGGGLKDAGPQHQVHTDASADAADSPSVPDATTSPDAAATPATAAASATVTASVQRSVPAHPLSRAMHFGGLGLGLAAGAAAAAVRNAVRGERSGGVMLNDANVDRLASTLCRLRGAALKVGQVAQLARSK